ncbi:EndoU domain-containing protein [Methylobacterium sp.]|jgi:hypothetical protein|uniref:EndoU domain-containing protein n=1 Tax=Methylobacterium sp. TaxID=409 RepID=UPI0025FFE4E7|nr:EndoU domain-containing protein [Methylobacterium sp.]MBY0257082.1 EndoU domain-containing protein [Methylobacterium sp.]
MKLPRSISRVRAQHILRGDSSGGGHSPRQGKAGKSLFPADWSDQTILDMIHEVATDSSSVTRKSRLKRVICEGVRKGIKIRVVLDRDGTVITGFPLSRGTTIAMANDPDLDTATLWEVLSILKPALAEQDYTDIADFIVAGERGLATDTIFCAVSEDGINVDGSTLVKLASLRNLYNTFGDADPGLAQRVLSRWPHAL